MKQKYSILSLSTSLLLLSALTFCLKSCTDEKVKKQTVTLYAYEVDMAAETYSAGRLKYMEAEYYEGNRLISKTYYNNDQSVKGVEKYHYTDNDSLPETSKYYDADGGIQANYTFTNQNDHQVQRNGYEGDTQKLLRQERYQYDLSGRRVSKIIFDSENLKQRSFLFGHDEFGNETQMQVLDYKDEIIGGEEYEIKYIDDDNRWIEKWGYVGKDKYPKTFYRKSYR